MTASNHPETDPNHPSESPEGGRQITGQYALAVTVIGYLLVLVLDTNGGIRALSASGAILVRIIPPLLLVTLLIGVSTHLLEPDFIVKYVGAGSGPIGYLIAAGSGILSHGPVYVWYGLLRDLREAGMRDGLVAVFLYNRAIKITLLPVFFIYFDLDFGIVLFFAMAIASIVQGVAIDWVLS